MISERNNRWSIESNVDHLETQLSASSNGLIVVVHNTPKAQMFVEQLMKPNSEIDDHDIADLIA